MRIFPILISILFLSQFAYTQTKISLKDDVAKTQDNYFVKEIDFLNTNTTQIDPLIILSKHVVSNNPIISENILCQVTKINISMQKNDSILLSHTGLKYYYKTDKKIFEQIKRMYLSKQWIKSDFETQIKEIAHNIRNTKSNHGIKQDRIYQYSQINLLSQLELSLAK